MTSRTIRADSSEYLNITITADKDISGDDVEVSPDGGINWHPAEHVTGGVRLLVGPAASPAISLSAGVSQVLVRIHAAPETPVIAAGSIVVVG